MEPVILTIITTTCSAIVSAIVGAAIARVKTSRRAHAERAAESAKLERIVKENALLCCRMAIYDEHFDIDEKIETYKLYRSLGGNHQTKTYMTNLVGMDIDQYLELHEGGMS
jgi:hypothetical protein